MCPSKSENKQGKFHQILRLGKDPLWLDVLSSRPTRMTAHFLSPGQWPRLLELRRQPCPQACAWQIAVQPHPWGSLQSTVSLFLQYRQAENFPNLQVLFLFCITIISSIYFCPLTFDCKQQRETRLFFQHFLRNFIS